METKEAVIISEEELEQKKWQKHIAERFELLKKAYPQIIAETKIYDKTEPYSVSLNDHTPLSPDILVVGRKNGLIHSYVIQKVVEISANYGLYFFMDINFETGSPEIVIF